MSHSKWRFEIHYLSHFSWHTNIGPDLCSVSNLPTSEPVLCFIFREYTWLLPAAYTTSYFCRQVSVSSQVITHNTTSLSIGTSNNLFSLRLWQYLTLKVRMYKCELRVQIFPQFWSQHGDTAALGGSRQLWAARASVRSYKHSFSPWHSGPDRPSTQHTWWVIIFHNQANCDCNTNHCFNKPPLTPLSSSHAHTRVFIPVLCTETVLSGIFKGFHFKGPLLLKFLNFDSDPTTLHRSIIYTQYSE